MTATLAAGSLSVRRTMVDYCVSRWTAGRRRGCVRCNLTATTLATGLGDAASGPGLTSRPVRDDDVCA